MSAESVILQGRLFQESQFLSTCTISRRTSDEPVLSEETGDYTHTYETVYSGPCLLKFGQSQPRDIDAQGQLLTEQTPTLKLPVEGSEEVTEDDTGVIDSNTLDAGLIGTAFRIAGVHAQTLATARRFPVEVLS